MEKDKIFASFLAIFGFRASDSKDPLPESIKPEQLEAAVTQITQAKADLETEKGAHIAKTNALNAVSTSVETILKAEKVDYKAEDTLEARISALGAALKASNEALAKHKSEDPEPPAGKGGDKGPGATEGNKTWNKWAHNQAAMKELGIE